MARTTSEGLAKQDIQEIGSTGFQELLTSLREREDGRYNVVGWRGDSSELKKLVGSRELCPASAFAVVADGLVNYRRTEPQAIEDTDSIRSLAKVMMEGMNIYGQAKMVDESTLVEQIKAYITSHGGGFEENKDWHAFIGEVSARLVKKAGMIDDVNR